MAIETLEAEKTETTTETVEDKNPALAHLSDKDKAEYLKLRDEAAAKRIKNKELNDELETLRTQIRKQTDEKLLEDGKLKELLDAKQTELDELLPIKEQYDEYNKYFEDQLEATLTTLAPGQKQLIEESGWNVSKKLSWAQKFKDEIVNIADGIGSKRPGPDVDVKDIKLEDYEGQTGRAKLIALKTDNPKLFDTILSLRKA